MEPNEAIIISGALQYSKYTGYGWSFKYDGPHAFDLEKIPHIVAVDATMNTYIQFREDMIKRDISKLYVALNGIPESKRKYATGHWGCGAFGGDKQLKAIQQIIAASEAQVELTYSSFKDEKFHNALTLLLNALKTHNPTVGELYNLLLNIIENSDENIPLFDIIIKKLNEKHNVDKQEKTNEEKKIVKEKHIDSIIKKLNEEKQEKANQEKANQEKTNEEKNDDKEKNVEVNTHQNSEKIVKEEEKNNEKDNVQVNDKIAVTEKNEEAKGENTDDIKKHGYRRKQRS
jgi:DNA polymerase III alpha subunit (gram-positive type)